MASRRRRFATLLLGRIWKFIAIFGVVFLVAALGFYILQGNQSLLNSFYWAIITLATIGYGDVVPTRESAKLFTIGIAVMQIFLLGYLITVISGVVSEEAQHRLLGTLGTDLTGHIVVLGYGPVGQAAVRELLLQEEKVAVVCESQADVANVRTLAKENQLYATYGPPAERAILERANVPAAHSVIVAPVDDTTALIAALNVRAIAPHLRVVVSVGRPELRDTLRTAGVTYVASPGDMGGRLCADAAFRPDIANTIEDLTTLAYHTDVTEFVLTDRTPLSTQTLPEAERLVRSTSDCLILGYARADAAGEYHTVLNPPSTFQFRPGDAVIVMGTQDNLKKLHRWIGVPQGR